MKKLVLIFLLLSVSYIKANTPRSVNDPENKFSYFEFTANYIPDSENKYGFGIDYQGFYSPYIFAKCGFTFPGTFEFAPFIGTSGEDAFTRNDMWYLGACPYHYMNVFIEEVSGVGDGLSVSGGYSISRVSLYLTANLFPYKKEAKSFGYLDARFAFYLGESWGIATSYQQFSFYSDKKIGMTSFHIFADI